MNMIIKTEDIVKCIADAVDLFILEESEDEYKEE